MIRVGYIMIHMGYIMIHVGYIMSTVWLFSTILSFVV